MKPPTRGRGWLIFFLILTVLTLLATGTLIAYNLKQQLKPEQLVVARKLWKDKGPKSYQLVYTTRIDNSERADNFFVRVEDGKVVEAVYNGRALEKNSFHNYGMERLYDFVEEFLDCDLKKGQPRTYARAIFQPETGALRWYVRRVMGSTQRVEIQVDELK